MTNIFKRFGALCAVLFFAAKLTAATTIYNGLVALPDCYSSVNSNTVACTNFSSTAIPLLPRCELVFTPTIVANTNGNATTLTYFPISNMVFSVDLSYDGGTTYTRTAPYGNAGDGSVVRATTAAPLTFSLALNGTNPVSGRFWFAATNFVGATHAKVTGVTCAATNTTTVTSLGYVVTGPSL